MQFQENELPALRKRLQTVDREAERLKGDVEEQEALLAVLRSEEEKAKDCLHFPHGLIPGTKHLSVSFFLTTCARHSQDLHTSVLFS